MSADGLVYSQRPRPTGGDITYRLGDEILIVEHTRGVDRLPLRSIARLRLSYEVGTLGSAIFRTTLRLEDGRKLSFSNLTWYGFGASTRQDEAYRRFVAGLVHRLGEIGRSRLEGGKPRAVWLIFSAFTSVILFGLVAFTASALARSAWGAGLVGLLAIGWAIVQLGPLVTRNRPCVFGPDDVPQSLLP